MSIEKEIDLSKVQQGDNAVAVMENGYRRSGTFGCPCGIWMFRDKDHNVIYQWPDRPCLDASTARFIEEDSASDGGEDHQMGPYAREHYHGEEPKPKEDVCILDGVTYKPDSIDGVSIAKVQSERDALDEVLTNLGSDLISLMDKLRMHGHISDLAAWRAGE